MVSLLAGEVLTGHDLKAVSLNSTKSLEDMALTIKYLSMSPDEQTRWCKDNSKLRDIISRYNHSNIEEVIDLVLQAMSDFPCLDTKMQSMLVEATKVNTGMNPLYSTDIVLRLCDLLLCLRAHIHEVAISEFYEGLSASLPVILFPIFTHEELDSLFCGQPTLDIATLKKATVYEDVSPSDAHISQFWDAIELLTPSEQSKLINFCSGRTRLPSSASDFPMNFKLTAPLREYENPDEVLPHSQTCFFSLSLPKYSSTEVTLEKLRYAISNAELMDADFMVRNAAGWENI